MASKKLTNPWLTEILAYCDYNKDLAEKALGQLSDDELHQRPDARSNSVAIYIHHLGGNHLARFTDFLTTDGEKHWRDRDAELDDNSMTRDELMGLWERGWSCMTEAIVNLTDEDLERTIFIRGQAHSVQRALIRALTHASYHCGQIVTAAKLIAGERWETITTPPGGSAALNRSLGFDPNAPSKG